MTPDTWRDRVLLTIIATAAMVERFGRRMARWADRKEP